MYKDTDNCIYMVKYLVFIKLKSTSFISKLYVSSRISNS